MHIDEKLMRDKLLKFCQENNLVGMTVMGFGPKIIGKTQGANPVFIISLVDKEAATEPVPSMLGAGKMALVTLLNQMAKAMNGSVHVTANGKETLHVQKQ